MAFCAYGCGNKAKYQFKNKVWCCEIYKTQCPAIKQKTAWNRGGGRKLSQEHRLALSKANTNNILVKNSAKKGGAANARIRKIPLKHRSNNQADVPHIQIHLIALTAFNID